MIREPTFRPRHVLMTADAVGGVWSYAAELCRRLERAGTRVTLAVMGPAPSDEQRLALSGLRGVELAWGGYALEWMREPWRDVDRAGEWLLGLDRRLRPDIIHLNGYCHAALPWSAPVVVVAHSCVSSWWEAVLGTPPPATYDEYRRRVAEGLAAADAVVAPTAAMLEALRRLYRPSTPTLVIPNGIEMGAFRRRRKEPVVLAAGRLWDPAKNLEMLARIGHDLPWPVRLAGDASFSGREAPELRGAECLGALPRSVLAKEMSRAGIFAHPALYEPFGLAPLEAAASGCALVLSDLPTLREVWGGAALLLPPDDDAVWRAALQHVIRSPMLRAQMARRARERTARRTAGEMAMLYLALYERVLAARRSTRPRGADRAGSAEGT